MCKDWSNTVNPVFDPGDRLGFGLHGFQGINPQCFTHFAGTGLVKSFFHKVAGAAKGISIGAIAQHDDPERPAWLLGELVPKVNIER